MFRKSDGSTRVGRLVAFQSVITIVIVVALSIVFEELEMRGINPVFSLFGIG